MKKLIYCFMISAFILAHCFSEIGYAAVRSSEVDLEKNISSAEKTGFSFLLDKMQNDNGLFYSWVEAEKKSDDILLEAMGQSVEYFALLGNKELFEGYSKITDDFFLSPKGYYFWSVKDSAKGNNASGTAFIDDLRLAKAYFLAKENGIDISESKLKKLSATIYKFNVNRKKIPVDFYEGKVKKKGKEISLFYLDVETMGKLASFDKKWQAPYENSLNLLRGMPENEHGLYPKNYKLDKKEYFWQAPVNMVENLYTAINAQKAGLDVTKFADFLRLQISKGHIFNHYMLNGESENNQESASVYALAARFFCFEKDNVSAKWCYEKVKATQISEKSYLHGGFGDEQSGRVYSFNQLETLLMFRYLEIMGLE